MKDVVYIVASLLVTMAALLFPSSASADPFLISDAYTVNGSDPDACSLNVSGGPVAVPTVTCTIVPGTGTEQPKCDLGSISVVGTYTLTMTCTRDAKTINTAGGGSFVPAASATSSPFAYRLDGAAIVSPQNVRLIAK